MLEKIGINNIETLRKLHANSQKRINYDKDFFEFYDKQNFIMKYFYKKFIKIIKINNKCAGYIWYEPPVDKYVRVWALYIEPEFISLLNESVLDFFNDSILYYEVFNKSKRNTELMKLGFNKSRYSILMSLDLEFYNKDKEIKNIYSKLKDNLIKNKLYHYNPKFRIRKFKEAMDEGLRCDIQNQIFADLNRKPLTIEDIYMDMSQDYYLGELCFFGMLGDEPIGYGQIIDNRNMYTIVNFGIIEELRGIGLGKLLLHEIILKAKKYGIKELFIRVDYENIKAINLYKWIGFKFVDNITLWQREL